MNGTGAVEPAADLNAKEYVILHRSDAPGGGSHLYRYEAVKVWPHDGPNAGVSRFATETYTQVSGLTVTSLPRIVSIDFDRNQTATVTSLDRSAKKVTVTTTVSGSTASLQEVKLNGFAIKTANAQGQVTLLTYDPLGRLEVVDEPRLQPGVTDHVYYSGTTKLKTVTGPDNRSTGFGYDNAGRISSRTDADNQTAYFKYDDAGNLTHQWGATVPPVRYAYNDLNQRKEMHTYRIELGTGSALPPGFSAPGDATVWNYQDGTGLLESRTDGAGSTTYTYTDLDRIATRTDVRGWVTRYEYDDPRKLLTKVDYTGAAALTTTDLIYEYDHAGRTEAVTDAAGRRTFTYYDSDSGAGDANFQNKSGRVYQETLPAGDFGGHTLTYTYQYGVAGRANGAVSGLRLGTGQLYQVGYEYDAVLRLGSVTYNGGTPHVYAYVPESNLVDTVTQGTGYRRDYGYQPDSSRVKTLDHAWGSSTTTAARLTYDAVGLRNTEKLQGSGYMSALGRAADPGVHSDYTYTARYELDDSGRYRLNADWTAGSLHVGTHRSYQYDAFGNRDADQSGDYQPNALNQYTAAPTAGSLVYDENGNLEVEGARSYEYDAENRLVRFTANGTNWTYRYDYLGRRIEKKRDGMPATRFVYDGWNLIAELEGSGTIQRRFVWGLDASGSLQGAGGVGGLLLIDTGTTQYQPLYDASHSVIGLYGTNGSLAAAYEYDPFGNALVVAGGYGEANPFRYSTKYTDAESGLAYYGLRYYHAQLGRFIHRDPIEEAGGLNLYGFCTNDPVNRYDYLGMSGDPDIGESLPPFPVDGSQGSAQAEWQRQIESTIAGINDLSQLPSFDQGLGLALSLDLTRTAENAALLQSTSQTAVPKNPTAVREWWRRRTASAPNSAGMLPTVTVTASRPGVLARVWNALTGWHFEGRAARNGSPPSFQQVIADPTWVELGTKQSIYHDDPRTPQPERKFIHPNGREAVFYSDTLQPVTDPRYAGTYNYVNPAPAPENWYNVGGWLSFAG